MVSSTSNSLLYKTLLSPQMNIDASPAGKQCLATLIGRVKKLDQCERNELSSDLGKILYELKNPTLPNAKPLEEKGVCILLLTDSGTHKKSHNLIDSFFRFVRNYFGDRVSSQSIIDKIIEIKTYTAAQPATPLCYAKMKEVLTHEKEARINAYRAKVGQSDQSERMRKLSHLKASCFELNKYLSGAIRSMSMGKSIDAVALARLSAQIDNLIATADSNELTDEFKHLIDALKRTSSDIKHMNDPSKFFADLLVNDSEYLTEDEKSLAQNPVALSKRDKITLKMLATKLLYSSALDKSKCLFKVLYSECNKEEDFISKILSGVELIEKRTNFLAVCEQSLIIDARIQDFRSELEIHNREIRLCAELYQTAKSLNSEIKQVNSNADRIALLKAFIELNPKESKSYMKQFIEHIMFLYGVLSGDWGTYGHLYPIRLEKYLPSIGTDAPEKQALFARLRTGLSAGYEHLDEAGKKAYAENFLDYLQIALATEQKLCASRRDQCNIEIQNAQRAKAQALVQAQAFVQPPQLIAPEPLVEQPPLTAQVRLVNLARELENVPNSLVGVCARLDAEFSAYKEAIHHNFYFIMLKANKIKSGHLNWGGVVFKGDNLNSLLNDDVTTEQLNRYRAYAMTLAAQVGKVSGVDDLRL